MDHYHNQLDSRKLRFLIFGLGAIGTYVGGSLLLSGQSVTFIDRSEVAEQILHDGLRMQLGTAHHQIHNPNVYKDIETAMKAGCYDIAIVAVKSFDTLELAQAISRTPTDFSVLSLQNGVENELLLATHLGQERVIAGSLTSAVKRNGPGDITLEKFRGVGIAEAHPTAGAVAAALNSAGLNARLYENGQSMKWSKMLTNLLTNASSAILDMTPEEIYADPDLYTLEVRQIREALTVMEALNIPVSDLPGTPVRILAFLLQSLPVRISQPILRQALGKSRGGKMPSFHIDFHAGRPKSEVDYLNGAVVRFARQIGVETPVNQVLNDTLLALVEGKTSKNNFTRKPEKLLALIKGT